MNKHIEDQNKNVRISDESPFAYRESYNLLRTNVMFTLAASDKKKKTIVVSSAMPSECKSTVSSNLAISLAKLNKKVLIIDGDLRKPRLHSVFEEKNVSGLTDVIVGSKTFEDSLIHIDSCNLDFLPAGTIPPNPSELLSSSAMHKLLETAEDIYDYIIVDSPPVLVVSDALMLSSVSAGIILSCRVNKTSYTEFSNVVSALKMANFPILGTVLVGSRRNSSSYRNYGKY